ncbi:glycosyltransferase family 39 protein [Methanoregula sp. UBA64]|uniref:glycosyltransferase family 39 protein n=1 Tax=Methanoregula sp. UBA64 TaxID=1915554 RepID=UPI0025FB1B8A|nr:glycosyltransferase family 39 protein [Methanoregula sp. UBA64]
MPKNNIRLTKYWAEITLAGIIGLACFLNLWNLWYAGFENPYYAAAVQAMLTNPPLAFFNPYDAAGFVTIDKPPVGLWVQAASAALFGFHGWALILPQVLAGIGSVFLIYLIIERPFGKPAGLIAAFILATTPVFVTTSRMGTMDLQLIFVVLLALWVALKAARAQSLSLLLVSMVLVGIAFNIKMIQAFVVVPAIIAVYLLGTTGSLRRKLSHLALAVLVLAAVSLSWALAVDAVPADQRPYIGTSGDNSIMGLILGHNGEEAFVIDENVWKLDGIGNPGPLRLIEYNLYVEFSWLLLLALIGLFVWCDRRHFSHALTCLKSSDRFSEKGITLIALSLWLLPALVYFSFTHGNWLAYYLATIAPPLAGLIGIGVVEMYTNYLKDSVTGWLLVVAIIVTALLQIFIFRKIWIYNPEIYGVLLILLAGGIFCSILLAWQRIKPGTNPSVRKSTVIAGIAVMTLLVAPVVWSGLSVIELHPAANSTDSKLEGFLVSHSENTTFLAAVPSSFDFGSSLSVDTGKPVMAVGGYFGTDRILSIDQMPGLVKNRTVRYFFLLPENTSINYRMARGYGENAAIYSWVEDHCMLVPDTDWRRKSTDYSLYNLYDCIGAA